MAITLQNLIDGIRIETRDPDGVNFKDPDVIYNANQTYRQTYQEIANQLDNEFCVVLPMDVIGSQREYDIPVESLRIISVELVVGGATWVPLKRYRRGVSPNYNGGANFGIAYALPTFDLQSSKLVLEPTPRGTVTNGMRVTYQAVPDILANLTDTVHADMKDMWIDLIVLRAARACFGQTEAVGGIMAPEILVTRLAELEKVFKESNGFKALSPTKKRRKGYFQ